MAKRFPIGDPFSPAKNTVCDSLSIGTTLPIEIYAKKVPLYETFLLSKYKKSGTCPDFL